MSRTLLWHILNLGLLALAFGVAVGAWTKVNIRPVTFSLLDSTIAQPVYSDTIAYGSLLAIVLIVPLFLYAVYCIYDYLVYRKTDIPNIHIVDDITRISTPTIYSYPTSCILVAWLWFYGQLQSMAIAILLTQWVKYYADELRPDFLFICFPNGIPPTIQSAAQSNNYLLNTAQCTPNNMKVYNDSFQSFFSGHTSTAFSACIYLSIFFYYRHIRVPFSSTRRTTTPSPYSALSVPIESWRYILICIPIVFATWVGASRWYDHKHHLIDVLIGALVGVGSAFIVYLINYDNYLPLNSLAALPYEYMSVSDNDKWSKMEQGLNHTQSQAPTYRTSMSQPSLPMTNTNNNNASLYSNVNGNGSADHSANSATPIHTQPVVVE